MHYLILNFKTYPEATGENALHLAEIANAGRLGSKVNVIVCPQAVDIYRIREKFPLLSIWAQHIDPIVPGRNTGWTSPTSIVMAGANGTLVNHSEHKLTTSQVEQTLTSCKHFQLSSCLAVKDAAEAEYFRTLRPDFLAYEPEELISGETSLIEADPQAAKMFVEKFQNHGAKLVLGAGVKSASDISEALKLGFEGILISSGFVKSEQPAEFLNQMLAAFN